LWGKSFTVFLGGKLKNLLNYLTFIYDVFRPPIVNPELQHVKAGNKAVPCKPQFCKLPDCSCGSTKLKGVVSIDLLLFLD